MSMGIPTEAMPMGIPTGAMPMGIPTGAMPIFSLSGSYGGLSGGIKMEDNSTVCDSRGNCMVTDEL
jgi:hypothetical protein